MAGLFAWVASADQYPPRIYCIIEADDRYEAEELAENFASQHEYPEPEYGDVIALYEDDTIEGTFKP